LADYQIPDDLLYTREDEWARRDENRLRIGITDYAQEQLGDIVFVELPEVGTALEAGSEFGVVESVKAVSPLYTPVSGTVVEVNADLADAPETVNEDCYGRGWMLVLEMSDPGQADKLLDAEAYQQYVTERSD